jgi:hypothetical protein
LTKVKVAEAASGVQHMVKASIEADNAKNNANPKLNRYTKPIIPSYDIMMLC